MRNASDNTRGQVVDIERIQRAIDDGPHDALLVTSPENVPYCSGFFNEHLVVITDFSRHEQLWELGR